MGICDSTRSFLTFWHLWYKIATDDVVHTYPSDLYIESPTHRSAHRWLLRRRACPVTICISIIIPRYKSLFNCNKEAIAGWRFIDYKGQPTGDNSAQWNTTLLMTSQTVLQTWTWRKLISYQQTASLITSDKNRSCFRELPRWNWIITPILAIRPPVMTDARSHSFPGDE